MKEITSEKLGIKVEYIPSGTTPYPAPTEIQLPTIESGAAAENKRPAKCSQCNKPWYKIIGDKPYCRKHAKLKTAKGKPLMLEKKRHRNEPCPCGSGKKFKTCCIHKTIV